MQLSLQITTGPHAGRKVLVRSGQIARIGRTEWADFSFPRDADLADVHFAVQCQLHGAKLRKLAPDRTISVNSQQVNEAELQPGDTIQAGQSSFVVTFDGEATPRSSSSTATASVILGAASVGAAGIAQVQTAAEREPSAVEIAEHLQMADEHVAIAKTVKTGPEYVTALAA